VEVFVDHNQLEDVAFARGGTVEDAVRHIQTDLCAPGRMVIRLRCDGVDVNGDTMVATLGQPATAVDRLEVFTDTKGALVADAMVQAAHSLGQTEEECGRVAELLTEGKTTEGIEALSQCVSAWQQIHDAVAKSIQMLEMDLAETTVNDQKLIDVLSRPKDVLLQIRDALQAQDHVLLADILQYELSDVTEQWHMIIAKLREDAGDS
jgi:hypothetical protein